MNDPFAITGAAVVCNSGGKTSGYSLRRHLDANGGALPANARCVFTNTGWERPETLDFLCEQEWRWGQKIDWLEFCRRPATTEELNIREAKAGAAEQRLARLTAEPASYFAKRKPRGELFAADPADAKQAAIVRATKYATGCRESALKLRLIGMDSYRVVSRATASTDGGPYQELLGGLERFRREVRGTLGVLPNGVQRICTGHLKMKIIPQFMADRFGLGCGEFQARLGLRADEEERLTKAGFWGNEGGRPAFPLAEAGVTKADVFAFWSRQPFGLSLKSHEGNCAGCYMKRRGALVDLIRRNYFDPNWWIGWEQRTAQRFRKERSYAGLVVAARTELDLVPPDDGDNGITCEGGYCSD